MTDLEALTSRLEAAEKRIADLEGKKGRWRRPFRRAEVDGHSARRREEKALHGPLGHGDAVYSNESGAVVIGAGRGGGRAGNRQRPLPPPAKGQLDVRAPASGNTVLLVDEVNERVGIGITSPDGKLHVEDGSAGSVTANAVADTIVAEASASGGYSVLVPNDEFGTYAIGSPNDNVGAQFAWKESTNAALLGSFHAGGTLSLTSGNGSTRIFIDASGDVGVNTTTPAVKLDINGSVKVGSLLRLTQTSTTGDPTTTEYPTDGDVGVHHNTTTGFRYFAWNDGGTIFKVLMT